MGSLPGLGVKPCYNVWENTYLNFFSSADSLNKAIIRLLASIASGYPFRYLYTTFDVTKVSNKTLIMALKMIYLGWYCLPVILILYFSKIELLLVKFGCQKSEKMLIVTPFGRNDQNLKYFGESYITVLRTKYRKLENKIDEMKLGKVHIFTFIANECQTCLFSEHFT